VACAAARALAQASLCLAGILRDICAYGGWELVLAHVLQPPSQQHARSSPAEADPHVLGPQDQQPSGVDHCQKQRQQQQREVVQQLASAWGLQYVEATVPLDHGVCAAHVDGAGGNASSRSSVARDCPVPAHPSSPTQPLHTCPDPIPAPTPSHALHQSLARLATQAGCSAIAIGRSASGRAALLLSSLLTDHAAGALPGGESIGLSALASRPVRRSHGLWQWQRQDSARYGAQGSATLPGSAGAPWDPTYASNGNIGGSAANRPAIRFVHPLLGVSAAQAEAFCVARGIPPPGTEVGRPWQSPPGAPALVASSVLPCAAQGSGGLDTSAWIQRELLPYLRAHFNPKVRVHFGLKP